MSDKAGKLIWLHPSQLEPNSWNPNAMTAFMYTKALESIQQHGFVDPVTAYDDGGFNLRIIDGEHRWRVASDLSIDTIPVFVIENIDDREAKKLTILLNELRGQALPEQMGKLLDDLLSTGDLQELLRELPYTEDTLRAFTELPPLTELPAPPTANRAPSEPERRWVERLYKMPIAAAMVVDQAIAQAKDGDEVEDWQGLERVAADFIAS